MIVPLEMNATASALAKKGSVKVMKHFSSLMVRTVLALLCLALLSLAVVTIWVMNTVSGEQYKANIARAEETMESLSTLLDNSFYDYISLATQITAVDDLRPIFLSQDSPVSQLKARKYLDPLKAVNQQIVDICLYIRKDDFFISSTASYTPESFVRDYYSFSRVDSATVCELFRNADTLITPGVPLPFVLPVGTVSARPNATSLSDSLLLLFSLPQWSRKPYATLGVFIKTEDIYKQLSIAAGDGAARILDSNGQTLAAVGVENLENGFAPDASVRLFRKDSNRFGLVYEAYIKEATLSQTSMNMQRLVLILLAMVLAVSLASLIFAKWVNRPIHQLLDRIGGSPELLPDESSYIQQYIFQLRKSVEQNEKYVDELMVRRLLTGKYMAENELARCEGFLKKDYAHCAVMVVRLSQHPEEPLPLVTRVYKHSLITILQEASLDTLTCVIASDEIGDALLQHVSSIRTEFPFTSADRIALGSVGDDLLQLHDSMLQAVNCMKEMLYQGRYGVEKAQEAADRRHTYPAKLMHHLKAAMEENDASAIRAWSDQLCDTLLNPHMSPEIGAIVAYDLAMLLPELSEKVNCSAQVFCQAFRQSIQQLLETLSSAPGDERADEKINTDVQWKIDQDIDEMLELPGFGISMISEKYDMSDSAFSHMFKRTFGVTFILHVNQKKIQRAKTLLQDTSYPLDAIALRLGYSSASNFTRMFKKSEGITPGAYRQQCRGTKA